MSSTKKFMEKARNINKQIFSNQSHNKKLIKSQTTDPIVITDIWGMNFIHYPGESDPLEEMLLKDFYKPEFMAIKRIVRQGNSVIDIGANVGVFSVFLSRQTGDKGQVFAFEPILNTFWRMKETLALNRCANVTPYQQAVSQKQGISTMNTFAPRYSVWNSFGKPEFGVIKPTSTEKVTTVTLDAFSKKHDLNKIDFIKIDVEGFEKEVLEGAKNLLSKKQIRCLSFEISEIPLKGAGANAKEIFDLLNSYGYSVYKFDMKSNKFIGPIKDSVDFYQNFYASRSDLRKL